MNTEVSPAEVGCNEGLGGWQLVPKEPTPKMLQAATLLTFAPCDDGAQPWQAGHRWGLTLEQIDPLWSSMLAAAPQPAELEALRKDAERLNWLDSQGYAYGFQDMHEGNAWEIKGPFANLRAAIDAELALHNAGDQGQAR